MIPRSMKNLGMSRNGPVTPITRVFWKTFRSLVKRETRSPVFAFEKKEKESPTIWLNSLWRSFVISLWTR